MATWLRDCFQRAFAWAVTHGQAVPTTRAGLLDSALTHLSAGASTRREFASALARGLGANMLPDVRAQFLQEMNRSVRWAVGAVWLRSQCGARACGEGGRH